MQAPSICSRLIIIVLIIIGSLAVVGVANAADSKADQTFSKLLEAHWAWTLEQNPTFATSLGVRDYDDRLSDLSLAAYDAGVTQATDFLNQLADVDLTALSEDNQLNHALLKLDLSNQVEAANHGGKYQILTNRGGPHLSLTSMVGQLPFFTEADYHSYLQRLAGVPEYMTRATKRIRAGIAAGWVQACAPMRGYEQSIKTHIVGDANDSRFMEPFANKPSVIKAERFAVMEDKAKELISNGVLPAYQSFFDFYMREYAPACQEKVGTDALPGGKEYYAHRVRLFTTTDQTPDQVHQVGLSEVARIRAEMDEVIKEAGFEGSFEEWLIYLRDNPDFYPKTAEERLNAVAVISKKIDGELPKLFGKLPRMPYGIKEIPLDIAEKTTTAYYQPPAGGGSRAGFHFVNTTLLNTRPLYQLEALSLHEAVPGHHLQIALAQELDLPNFRRYGGQTVFVEGWGLYAERLGLETGFYQTPYTNFGRLSYEMWRACRLVVDTGLHSKGWTRQQAIDYMLENSGLSLNNVTSEIDRYISWPGQALAYKTGELKIRELRAHAESALAERFDVRVFHDKILKILENGALPLSVLESIINNWIDSQTDN